MGNTIGNGMAMREAILMVKDILDKYKCMTETFSIYEHEDIDRAKSLLEQALAEPPRNCDIKSVCSDSHKAYLDDENNWDEWGSPKLAIQDWLLAKAKAVPDINHDKHPQRGED